MYDHGHIARFSLLFFYFSSGRDMSYYLYLDGYSIVSVLAIRYASMLRYVYLLFVLV
jgi:hypothetical protein